MHNQIIGLAAICNTITKEYFLETQRPSNDVVWSDLSAIWIVGIKVSLILSVLNSCAIYVFLELSIVL